MKNLKGEVISRQDNKNWDQSKAFYVLYSDDVIDQLLTTSNSENEVKVKVN